MPDSYSMQKKPPDKKVLLRRPSPAEHSDRLGIKGVRWVPPPDVDISIIVPCKLEHLLHAQETIMVARGALSLTVVGMAFAPFPRDTQSSQLHALW